MIYYIVRDTKPLEGYVGRTEQLLEERNQEHFNNVRALQTTKDHGSSKKLFVEYQIARKGIKKFKHLSKNCLIIGSLLKII